MSKDPAHGASEIRGSEGGASKWLLGGLAAVVLLGGGYYAWESMSPDQDTTEILYDDRYSDPLHAAPLDQNAEMARDDITSGDSAAPAASATRTTTRRAASTRTAAAVPEETIGITPASASTDYTDSDDIIVTAPRRPIWARVPSERRLSALYPARALERGREGEASLRCTVQERGALDCVRLEETPGFGTAALRVAHTLRHASTLADGSDATGTPVNLRVVFRIDDDPRRGRG